MVCPEGLKAKYGEDVCLLANPNNPSNRGLISVIFSNLSVEGKCMEEYWVAPHLIEPANKV